MQDPYGSILVAIRDYAPVAAIIAGRISSVAEEPPSIRLRAQARSMRPFGANANNIGVQGWNGIAQCYGTTDPSGEILSSQLAGYVVDALHGLGAVYGSTYLLRVWTPDIGETLLDPVTEWPYHSVRIETYAATQAVSV